MIFKSLIRFIPAFLLISCAQIVPLTGGDKDIEPPKEVESNPQNGSVQFTATEIEIQFDEFVQLQNLQSQLVVSPYMENDPQVKVRGKKLIVELKDTLLPNTTYSLNFGNAIVDITENNPIPNYKYVFSTGSFVDSLSYQGTIVNAFDLTPVEQTSVLLYTQFEDSVPLLERPRYIAITDKEGKFEITNIAHGTYKVFAIKDINANYLFDLPNEQIAFENDSLVLNESSEGNQLFLFEQEAAEQYVVMSEHKQFGGVKFILNKPVKQLRVNHFSPEDSEFLIESNPTNDTVMVWAQLPEGVGKMKNYEDYLRPLSSFQVMDSSYVIDTISTDIYTKLDDSLITFSSNIQGIFDLNKSIELVANQPLNQEINWDNVQLFEDSVEVGNTKNSRQKIGLRNVQFSYKFKEGTKYKLVIPKGAFTTIYGSKNDTVIYEFRTRELSDYGKVDLAITPNFNEAYIVQLRRGNKLVRQHQFKGDTTLNYEYLNPGNYELRLIVDENEDESWTTGNYLNNQQPEKVIFYKKDILIKANWDNEISWIIKE